MNETWYKSSYSNGSGGNCVEVAGVDRGALVRDSKRHGGPILRFGGGAWGAFVEAVREGNALR